MEVATVGVVIGVLTIALLASGVWIGAALGMVGIFTYYLHGGAPALQTIGHITYNALSSYDFVAMPLFIFMATILANGGIASRLYTGSEVLFARLPGGLLHANVAGCALFASICGSTVATCAAMSTIALPELEKRKYPESISYGSLAASGTLGPMIPPSIAMIVYAVLTETSIGKLFIAGIMPGILISGLFMAYIVVYSLIAKNIASEKARGLKETVLSLLSIWPVALLFLIVLGSIYLGICTAVEAGALGCSGSLIIVALFKQLNFENLRMALRQGTTITTLMFFILMGAMILGHGASVLGIPQYLAKAVIEAELTRNQFLIVLTIFYFILGCFLDGSAMMVCTMPLVFPIVTVMGIDPVWFGVTMIVYTELCAITPPVGVNLFVIQGITKKPLEVIFRGVIPFIILLLLAEVLLVIWPEIALFLPNQMR